MTNDDNMNVVFHNDNIKGIIGERLADAEIGIGVEAFDIIVAEWPDNEENIRKISPLEKNVQVWISGLPIEDQIRELMEQSYARTTPAKLCESMEQILRKTGNENVFSRIRVIKSGCLSGSAGNYHLLIAMGLKKAASGYMELFQYMIDSIKEKLEAAGDFLEMSKPNADRQRLFGDMQKKWLLFGSLPNIICWKTSCRNRES